jgi:hypothetical protein
MVMPKYVKGHFYYQILITIKNIRFISFILEMVESRMLRQVSTDVSKHFY